MKNETVLNRIIQNQLNVYKAMNVRYINWVNIISMVILYNRITQKQLNALNNWKKKEILIPSGI